MTARSTTVARVRESDAAWTVPSTAERGHLLSWPFDRRVMTGLLAARLGPAPGPCRVLDAKLEPGVRALVLYEYAGRLVRGDLDADASDPAAEPAVAIRLSPFPDDPELPLLSRIVDPCRLGPVLADHLATLGVSHLQRRRLVRRCQVTLLRYRPGKRATVMVANGGPPARYVVKCYHDTAKAIAVAADAVGLSAAAHGPALSLAPFLGAAPLGSEGEPVLVHAMVSGSPLDRLVASAGIAPTRAFAGVAQAARAIAELHETTYRATRSRSAVAEVCRFSRRAGRLAVLDPGFAEALTSLAERLHELHHELPPGCAGTVHGDCKPSQFLIGPDRAHLLDLDHVGVADPAVDVGTFLASLRQLAIRDRLARRRSPPGLARSLSRVFLVNYTACRGDVAPSAPRVAWHQAAALERKALRAFARAPRSPLPPALAAEAHAVLDTWQEGPL